MHLKFAYQISTIAFYSLFRKAHPVGYAISRIYNTCGFRTVDKLFQKSIFKMIIVSFAVLHTSSTAKAQFGKRLGKAIDNVAKRTVERNAEIASVNDVKYINLIGYTIITPLIELAKKYLPDVFTIENDVFGDFYK